MKKIPILIILIFITKNICAQIKDPDIIKFISKYKYPKFLFLADSSSQAKLFTVGIQYLHTTNYQTLKPGGTSFSLGFNLARLFTKKRILGVFIDIKGIKGFTKQKFSSEFVSDFNLNFNSNYNSQEDSARAYLLNSRINSSNMSGNYRGDIGVMFSLFPQKFGGIMLAVKKGYRSYVIHGIYGNPFIGKGKNEKAYFDLDYNYAIEIILKPYSLFKNSFFITQTSSVIDILKLVTIGFYYEQTNLLDADIEGLPIKSIVSKSFMDKYGMTNMYGFKIGLALY